MTTINSTPTVTSTATPANLDIVISVVLFKHSLEQQQKIINECSQITKNIKIKIYFVNNRVNNKDNIGDNKDHLAIEYLQNDKNVGFGRAHNLVINKEMGKTKYFLIMNPDISFRPQAIEGLFKFMEDDKNMDVGLTIPKILNPDGSIQFVNKRLPSPSIFFLRKFFYKTKISSFRRRLDYYEMRDLNLNQRIICSNISGCFMFFRADALKNIAIRNSNPDENALKCFDERFFLYFEDTDISRRVSARYKSVVVSEYEVIHQWERGTHNNFFLLLHTLCSAYKYFNKWGWWKDSEKEILNATVGHYRFIGE
ncbi:MAG: glycosyltransferase family 2 protein [Oligoflexia bacterium]|nr:glycosyltransferase family 2 protein [Oligoflexia bacterium]